MTWSKFRIITDNFDVTPVLAAVWTNTYFYVWEKKMAVIMLKMLGGAIQNMDA
jgi:hypothetical protein